MKNFTETQERIANKCDELKELLLEKNRKYGNSALEPKRCFSKASAIDATVAFFMYQSIH